MTCTTFFDSSVAIPFVLNAFGLVLTITACAILSWYRRLTVGTERFYFLCYIAGLFLLAAAFSRIRWLSFGVFLWCVLEVGLAALSDLLAKYRNGTSLLPRNIYTQPVDGRFKYHPLLQAIPKPDWHQRILVHDPRNAEIYRNFPINWAEVESGKLTFIHNSYGARGIELSARDLKKKIVFVYGGSTTYDLAVTQGETWVEQLQNELGREFTLLNFGAPAYSTTENLIQTVFYQDIDHRKPVCAIYYIGFNDIHNAFIKNLDRAYADWHLPLVARLARKPEVWAAKYSPVIAMTNSWVNERFDSISIPAAPEASRHNQPAGNDKFLEGIFSNHIRAITVINSSRGIRSIFLGQMLNRDYLLLNSHEANRWAPLVNNGDVWQLQERFNSLLMETADQVDAKYIDAGIQHFGSNDFADQAHFIARGSKKFAKLIAREVEAYLSGRA